MQYDSLIDWTEFYRERLPHGIAGKNGVNRSARCPIHDGRDDNFSFSVVDGRWHCFSHCGGGQARDLLVALGEASDVREADKILDGYAGKAGGGGKASTAGKAGKPQRVPETLESFARAKHFGVDWLRGFGLRDGMAYNTPCVEFPYYGTDGKQSALRHRFGAGGSQRFGWRKGDKPSLYGLWLQLNNDATEVVLCEGESDTLSLLMHDVPALGVPGASSFQVGWAAEAGLLDKRKISLHRENDGGGATFVQKCCEALRAAGYAGKLCEFSVSAAFPSLKDLSDLHTQRGDDWSGAWRRVLETEKPVDLAAVEASPASGASPAKLESYKLDALPTMNTKPPAQLVAGLLTPGLAILAGAPKLGKSWLALALALAVGAGVPFLGRTVEAGAVLLLDLEGSPARLASRLSAVWSGALPSSVTVAHRTQETLAGGGLLAQLCGWVEAANNPKLIVLDTVGRVRGAGARNLNAYENDTQIFSGLQSFTQESGVAVLCVHHLRKQAAGDALERVSGSMGLSGIADNYWLLFRARTGADSDRATLEVGGRDIESASLLLRWQNPGWALLADDGAAFAENECFAASPAVRAVQAFTHGWKSGQSWQGTATDFAVACAQSGIACDVAPNQLAKDLRRYAKRLYDECGVVAFFFRKRQGNGLRLSRYVDDGF